MLQAIHHTPFIIEVPNFLDADTCAQLIDQSTAHGYEFATVRTHDGQQSLPTIRNNDRVVMEMPEMVQRLWQGVQELALPVSEKGEAPVGLPAPVRFYKYSPGQQFKMHKDGPWTQDGHVSQWTMLVYLNEEFTGGATIFRDIVTVQPKTGTAVFFKHKTWHEGEVLHIGTKYVLRSDVLFEVAP